MAHSFLKILLFIAMTSENYFKFAYSTSGVVWNRHHNDFVPIESHPEIHTLVQNLMEESRDLENYNFQKEEIKIAVVTRPNLINIKDGEITGFYGELWNLVAQRLNFTIVPIKTCDYGEQLENGSYDGALGMLMRNEVHIIARTAMLAEMGDRVHLVPIYRRSFRVYTKSDRSSTRPQISKIFLPKIWCLIIAMFVLTSFVSFAMQKISSKTSRDRNVGHGVHDHFFYTFSVFCCQGFLPDSVYRHTKIISFTKAMFAFLILTSASSQLVSIFSNEKPQPAVQDLEEMFRTTNYSLILFKRGEAYQGLLNQLSKFMGQKEIDDRTINIQSFHVDVYGKACGDKGKYATLLSEDFYWANQNGLCNLMPAPKSYFPSWIGSIVSKKFRHKKTIDMSMLKIWEVGLRNRLLRRGELERLKSDDPPIFHPVGLEQVAIPFAILGIGMILSIIIFVIEHIVYLHQCNQR